MSELENGTVETTETENVTETPAATPNFRCGTCGRDETDGLNADSFSMLLTGKRSTTCKECRAEAANAWTTERADYRKVFHRALRAKNSGLPVIMPQAKTWKAGDVIMLADGRTLEEVLAEQKAERDAERLATANERSAQLAQAKAERQAAREQKRAERAAQIEAQREVNAQAKAEKEADRQAKREAAQAERARILAERARVKAEKQAQREAALEQKRLEREAAQAAKVAQREATRLQKEADKAAAKAAATAEVVETVETVTETDTPDNYTVELDTLEEIQSSETEEGTFALPASLQALSNQFGS